MSKKKNITAQESGNQRNQTNESASMNDCLKKATQALDLVRKVSKQTEGIVEDYEFPGGINVIGELDDLLGSLRETLKQRADGRPKPFSIFDEYGYTLERIHDRKDRLQEERKLRMWGEVGDSGVYIGGRDFSFETEELLQFRDWLNSAIGWHQEKLKNKATN